MIHRLLLFAAVLAAAPSYAQTAPKPPVAAQKPHEVKSPFGATRRDEYYWLRDDTRKNPEMLAYLNAENAYADTVLAPTAAFKNTLYKEIVGRIKQDDSSVPYRDNGYYYYTRFETGQDYPITARRKASMDAPEEILFDQPAMAKGLGYFQIGDFAVTEDGSRIAWAEDKVGRRQYTVRIKTIADGAIATDTIENVEPNLVWADDGKTLFYVEKDPVTLLSKRVKMHVLGTPASADKLVYEEKDDTFYMGIGRTADDKYICITLQSTVSNEQRCASAAAYSPFTVVAPRERDFLYDADHIGDHWIIRTNWNALNYKLMTVKDADAGGGRAKWTDLVPHSKDVFIESFRPFDGFLAVEERSGGLKRVRTLSNSGKSDFVKSDEPAYAMTLSGNVEPDTDWVRYVYTSLVTPSTTYEVNAKTGERRVLKVQPTPGYDPSNYVTERVWATARDGTKIPVSIAYRKGFKKDGKAALFQYAYGSYGYSQDPSLNTYVPSLLDRGMVYALAHIRGGQDMGRAWYDAGHLYNKKNSFTDFIDVTRDLVKMGYADKGRVAAMGGSAGGLLMGAVANMAPQDYRVMIAQVPFVDVVTTMLDPTIPLTTGEYDEWGNPEQKSYYDYMLSYSPYDNVAAKPYPALFVGTGLWDSQVQYYEPAKWVARLRRISTGTLPLVFRVNMEAGHGGKSGRFRRYQEQAEFLAFALDQLEVKP